MKASRPEIEPSDPKASKAPVFDLGGKPIAPRAKLQTLSKKSPSDFRRTFVFSVFRRETIKAHGERAIFARKPPPRGVRPRGRRRAINLFLFKCKYRYR